MREFFVMTFEPTDGTTLARAVIDAKMWAAPWTTGLYGIDEEGPRLAGSATYIQICGQVLMLTAEHVMYKALQFGRPARYSNGSALAVDDWIAGPSNLDIALIFVGDDPAISPAAFGDVARSSRDVSEQHLFVQGYPESRSRYTAFLGGPVSDTAPYITYTLESTWSAYDAENHFLVHYPGPDEEQISEVGKPIFLPSPEGLSGCGVWSLGQSLRGFAGAGKFVGVAHRHVEDKRALFVTRIEPILAFVLEALRRRAAYKNWLERGCPLWDDLTDWDVACAMIPELT